MGVLLLLGVQSVSHQQKSVFRHGRIDGIQIGIETFVSHSIGFLGPALAPDFNKSAHGKYLKTLLLKIVSSL